MEYNTICHVEFSTDNVERSAAFYEALFGWNVERKQTLNNRPYFSFETPEGVSGGIIESIKYPPGAGGTLVFILVEDMDATLEKAVELGGSVAVEKSPSTSGGSWAIFDDPYGNPVGLIARK